MKRWIFTAVSFAAVIGVSVYAVLTSAPGGVALTIPAEAHFLALLAFVIEVVARSAKMSLSAKAVGTELPFSTAVRTSLGGDFGASITPARMGAEPARFLILSEAGIAGSRSIIILYAELFFEMISMAAVVLSIALIFETSRAANAAMIGIVGGYTTFVLGIGTLAVILSRGAVGAEPPAWARRMRLHGKRWLFVEGWFSRVRATVESFKRMRVGWGIAAFLASIVHIGIRFTILPAIVYISTRGTVPLSPLVVWPLMMIYGAGMVPAPAGGGAVELTFRATLGKVIPASIFGASLVWWRFYTFYIYIAIGALVAGNTALRAVREAEEVEEELERA